MGRVLLAHDPEIDRAVAIKTIQIFAALPERERAEARERFLREARAAGKLLHPGIVTLFDVGETDGLLYLAMEYVEGTTLDVYCQPDKLLPVKIIVELVAAAADALEYAHGTGVVHRDIKPANLMRSGEHSVKIMDFGLALPSRGQLTQDSVLRGTPSYMSPEQIRGAALDGRSDLFSLAVVLYEMLTGEKPFLGDSISSIIFRIVNEPPRDASAMSRRVPPALDAFLQRALSKTPEERFASGAVFASALRGTVAGLSAPAPARRKASAGPASTSPSKPATSPPRSRPRRSSLRPWLLATVLVVVAAAGGYYYFGEQLGLPRLGASAEVWWETRVVTEPPGVELSLDGVPLDPQQAGLVRFRPEGPFGVLSAQLGCRTVERPLDPADAGGEIVLVIDPEEVVAPFDPGVGSAEVRLNGERLGDGAVELQLDLCRENRLQVQAAGFYPVELAIPAQATPLEARTLLAGLQLDPIPIGRLLLPESGIKLVYYVDGERLRGSTREVELTEGEHELRIKNEAYWIDVRDRVSVVGGETVEVDLAPPALTTLVVQAFPANCKVYLKRRGASTWKYFDDTPVKRRIAIGPYDLRVELNPTGETRDQQIELRAGDNPPVRVSFGKRS
jgi:hypothetical protein